MENNFKIGDIVYTKKFGGVLQVNQILPEGMISCIYKTEDSLHSILIHYSLLDLKERMF